MAQQTRWIWDLYPLNRHRWESQQWIDDGTPAGQSMLMERERDRRCWGRYGVTVIGTVPERRWCYIPTTADLELLRSRFPEDDPHRPAWHRVKAVLVAGGHDPAVLDKSEAPVLLTMLAAIQTSGNAESEPAHARSKRGRLSSKESKTKRATMLARLAQHPSLVDDVAKLAEMVGVSLSTVRRWLNEEKQRYELSAAATPGRTSRKCKHCGESISGYEKCPECECGMVAECIGCHLEKAHNKLIGDSK